jgi:molybdenum cofactor cytidylyltransferase
MKWGLMILAAGKASRMGKAKMLLPYKDKTILHHIINEALAVSPSAIKIVTGHYHDLIKAAIAKQPVDIVFNSNYTAGMSSSIQIGLTELLEDAPDLAFVIIIVSDQPFLNRMILSELINQYTLTNKGIIAASYDGIMGTPVLLSANYYTHLYNLKGDQGARGILQQFSHDVKGVEFKLGELDIDTEEDYQQFCNKLNERHVG